MRIIGRIPHPQLAITVFSNDGRFPVQFELGGQTQVYRFRQDEQVAHLGDIQRLVDAAFLEEVLTTFRRMQATQARIVRELNEGRHSDELPDIL